MSDPYKVLGISRDATDEQVKEAYREMAKKYHPDNYQGSPIADLANEKMKEVNEAYDQIMNERKNRKNGGSSSQGYSGGYNPNYVGPQIQRDYAYHQGTAWPWLMGFYMEAYLRIYKMSGISFVERQLIGLEDEMTSHCVGSLPELFDGNPPFKGRGAVSFAMNVAEILRILKLLSKYNL